MTNIASNSNSRPAHFARGRQFLAAVARVLSNIERERRVRRTILSLSQLNDRTLRDIGMERDGIEEAVRHRAARW